MPNFVFSDNAEFYNRWKAIADAMGAPAFSGTFPNPILEDDLFIWQQMMRVALASGTDGATSEKGITATGATQATARPLTEDFNRVDTVAAGTGVRLDAATINKKRVIANNGANNLNVYPILGDNFLGDADDVPVVLPPGSSMEVFCFDGEATVWTLIS